MPDVEYVTDIGDLEPDELPNVPDGNDRLNDPVGEENVPAEGKGKAGSKRAKGKKATS